MKIEHEQKEIEVTPEQLADAFAVLFDDDQAKIIGLLLDKLRAQCGSDHKMWMQMAYINDELKKQLSPVNYDSLVMLGPSVEIDKTTNLFKRA